MMDELKKLQTLKDSPELAIFDELTSANEKLQALVDKEEPDKTTEIIDALNVGFENLAEEIKKNQKRKLVLRLTEKN